MKKIIVIGSGGSGKLTFSRLLGEKLGIPVIHLDQLFWQSGWTRRPTDEWLAQLNQELEKETWIMDGNFGATREMRIRHADTIISRSSAIFMHLPHIEANDRIPQS